MNNKEAVQHHICTQGPPISERPRRLIGKKLAAARKEFNTLLARGIIRPSASPLHLVPKKLGDWRATGDYRKINSVTIPNSYPLPIIEDLLQECHNSTVFSKVDLQRAYYHVPVAPEDI
ncbi:hypothetical protein PUN28_002094 [Cardiocondyla obscurior]|uniref:Reverse transcriptase domain-containing protein n=1 Tax=Cardiocondyla obscurior TaxID=286306 RepID=A0AAW2GSJ3_9HYME